MVEIHIRDKNNIINVLPVGKQLIRGRTGGSPFLLNPIDILLSSLGVCIGGKIVEYCRLNDIDTNTFQSITINYEKTIFTITLQCLKDFYEDNKNWRLVQDIKNCSIAQLLKDEISVEFTENTIPIKELKKESKPCCGG